MALCCVKKLFLATYAVSNIAASCLGNEESVCIINFIHSSKSESAALPLNVRREPSTLSSSLLSIQGESSGVCINDSSSVYSLTDIDLNLFVCLIDLILHVPSTLFQLNSDGSSWVEPVLS